MSNGTDQTDQSTQLNPSLSLGSDLDYTPPVLAGSSDPAQQQADARLAEIQTQLKADLESGKPEITQRLKDYTSAVTQRSKNIDDLTKQFIKDESRQYAESEKAQQDVSNVRIGAAQQTLSDEQQLEAYAQKTPTKQAAYAGVMHTTSSLALLATIGGALTKTSGMGMLGAMNGIVQGANEGAENQYADAYNKWKTQYDAWKDHMNNMQQVYNMLTAAYQGRADAKEKAAEHTRSIFQEKVTNEQLQMASSANLLDATFKIRDGLAKNDIALAKIRDAAVTRGLKTQQQGSRERVMQRRIVIGANEATLAAHNIMRLPVTVHSPFLPTQHWDHFWDAPVSALGNTIAKEDYQMYDAMSAGVERSLAAIEASGLVPSNALTGQMSKVIIRPGDTYLTAMARMAEMRQIVTGGLEPIVNDETVPAQQRQYIQSIINTMGRAVPFTMDDVIDLQQGKNPGQTLGGYAKGIGLDKGSQVGAWRNQQPGAGAGTAAPPTAGPASGGGFPLPARKEDMVENRVYNTQYGLMQWSHGRLVPLGTRVQ